MSMIRTSSRIEQDNTNKEALRVSISERPKNLLSKILAKKDNETQYNVTLEKILNVEKDILYFDRTTFERLKPDFVYTTANDEGEIKIMTHYNETQISCLDNEDLLIDLVTQNCRARYNLEKLTLMHMGLVIIGIQPLIRPGLGTKALVSLLDAH